jgi:SPP1 family predicted phage head-tail adaptor
MRSGRLRHRLILQQRDNDTRNAYGESVPGWTTTATVWGAIEPLSGKEYLAQQQIQSEVSVRIVMRYYAGVDPTWRIKNDGLYYDIISVIDHDLRGRMMTLMCREGVSDDTGTDSADALLLQSGSYLLLESGSNLLLES